MSIRDYLLQKLTKDELLMQCKTHSISINKLSSKSEILDKMLIYLPIEIISWDTLPSIQIYLSHVIAINAYQFILIPHTLHKASVIYTYNTITKEFNALTTFPMLSEDEDDEDEDKENVSAVSYNQLYNAVHIFIKNGYLVTYHIDNKEWKWIETNQFIHLESCCVAVGNIIHLLNPDDAQLKHFLFDYKNQTIKRLYSTINGCKHNGKLIYMKKKQRFLLFEFETRNIFQFSLLTNNWKKLKQRRSFYIDQESQIILTSDEKYMIYFRDQYLDGIYAIDTETFQVIKSKINWPRWLCKGYIPVIQDNMGNIIASGFIRKCWKSKHFNHIRYPSKEIIMMIQSFYFTECYVHILRYMEHWKTGLSVLFDNMS